MATLTTDSAGTAAADELVRRVERRAGTQPPSSTSTIRVRVLPRARVAPAIATALYLIRAVQLGEEPPTALDTAASVLVDILAPNGGLR